MTDTPGIVESGRSTGRKAAPMESFYVRTTGGFYLVHALGRRSARLTSFAVRAYPRSSQAMSRWICTAGTVGRMSACCPRPGRTSRTSQSWSLTTPCLARGCLPRCDRPARPQRLRGLRDQPRPRMSSTPAGFGSTPSSAPTGSLYTVTRR